jgi:hypothetical protein
VYNEHGVMMCETCLNATLDEEPSTHA